MPRGIKGINTPLEDLPPAISEEGQETRMIALARNLAEKQLKEGTASSQVITHYLKKDAERERLEIEKLKLELELTKAKTEVLLSEKRQEEMYQRAIEAMAVYAGHGDEYHDT